MEVHAANIPSSPAEPGSVVASWNVSGERLLLIPRAVAGLSRSYL